jgi:hypothetical protein
MCYFRNLVSISCFPILASACLLFSAAASYGQNGMSGQTAVSFTGGTGNQLGGSGNMNSFVRPDRAIFLAPQITGGTFADGLAGGNSSSLGTGFGTLGTSGGSLTGGGANFGGAGGLSGGGLGGAGGFGGGFGGLSGGTGGFSGGTFGGGFGGAMRGF